MPGRFLPADHSKGDANTIGGYAAVHGRPAAFEGTDGMSYSVEIAVDRVDGADPFAAYFLFLRWRRVGPQGVEGHLESDYQCYAASPEAAVSALGAMPLNEVRDLLNTVIAERSSGSARRWWDVMHDEHTDDRDDR